MLSCKEITENANQYLDKELSFWMRLKVRMHLKMCQHCQRYVEQLQLTIEVLRKLKPNNQLDQTQVDNVVSRLAGCDTVHTRDDSSPQTK